MNEERRQSACFMELNCNIPVQQPTYHFSALTPINLPSHGEQSSSHQLATRESRGLGYLGKQPARCARPRSLLLC